jgi:DNA-binding NarL/FixJ family response regulator
MAKENSKGFRSLNSFDNKVRILVADDHEAIRLGVQRLIECQPGWTVCGLAASGEEAVEKSAHLKPDIVVLDVAMPGLSGIDATRRIKRRNPLTEVIIYTALDAGELISEAFEAGAKAFVVKYEASSNLIEAIKTLAAHKPFFTDAVSERLFSKFVVNAKGPRKKERVSDHLTAREREIVQLLAEGKSNKAVAANLGVSLRTVEGHRARLLRKLGLDSLAGLVRYAIRSHIIQP